MASEDRLNELIRLTESNTQNIDRLTKAVDRLASLAETQTRHDERLKTLFNDRDDVYHKIEALQDTINKLIAEARAELEGLKSATDTKLAQHRVKMLMWTLGIVGSALSALALYTIKH